jgi:hypothetical protein
LGEGFERGAGGAGWTGSVRARERVGWGCVGWERRASAVGFERWRGPQGGVERLAVLA